MQGEAVTHDGAEGAVPLAAHENFALANRVVSTELEPAAREVLPPAEAGERYHVRGLTERWASELAEAAVRDGRQPHTARSYTYTVARWLRFCLLEGLDPLRARRSDIDHWIARMRAGPATVRTRLAAVSSWYRYLAENDVPTSNPAAGAARPKRQRQASGSTTAHLTGEELNAILREASRVVESAPPERLEVAVRNAAIMRVLATTGVRSGAVQHAQLPEDLGHRGGHRVLRYATKGGGRADKPLVPYASAMLDAYLDLRATREQVVRDELAGPLFAGCPYRGRAGGRPLASKYLASVLRALAARAGIAEAHRLVPHSLRHTVATALGQHRSLAEVQDFLDHADPRTTRIYLRVNTQLNNSPAYTMAGLIDHEAEADAGGEAGHE